MTIAQRQFTRFSPTTCAAWLCVAFLALPILVVIPFSLTTKRYLSFPTDGISFQHYEALLRGAWLSSTRDSLIVASGATVVALILGASLAIAIRRLPGRVAQIVRVLALAPLIVPGIIHALAFYRALAFTGFLDTYLGIIMVHGLKAMPFVFISVSAVLISLDPYLEKAARSLGASQTQSLRLVILPNIVSGLVSGGFLAFITSWDEIVVAIFITGRKVHTLPKMIWESLVDNLDPAVAALATLMIVITAMLVISWELLSPSKRIKRTTMKEG